MNTPGSRWSTQTKMIVSLLILALFIYLLFRFSAVIPPFILAVVLAYILSPSVGLLQEHLGIPRFLATLLTYLILITVAIVLPILILPPLISQLTTLNLDIQKMFETAENILGNQYQVLGRSVPSIDRACSCPHAAAR